MISMESCALLVLKKRSLTNELQTIDAIVAQIEGEEITKAKITARLTSLVKNGIAEKEDVKDEEGRKLKAYKLVA